MSQSAPVESVHNRRHRQAAGGPAFVCSVEMWRIWNPLAKWAFPLAQTGPVAGQPLLRIAQNTILGSSERLSA